MKKIITILLILPVVLVAILFTFRISKDVKKKLKFTNTYAIQNVKTGKDIRVHNADLKDGAGIILYNHQNWECMTWEFILLEDSTYLLKNLYTQKTFQPSATPGPGVSLCQQPLGGTPLQYWEFLKQFDETYLIRLKGTEMYVTGISDQNNASIVLLPKQYSNIQLWKLVRQNPIM